MTEEIGQLRQAVTVLGAGGTTTIPGVSVHRSEQGRLLLPNTHNPYICLLVGGSLTLHTQGEVCHMSPGEFVLSRIDTPSTAYTPGTPPALALVVEFSLDEAVSVLLDFDGALAGDLPAGTNPSLWADRRLLRSLIRMVGVQEEEDRLPFMAKHLKREVIFRLITSSQGRTFVSSVTNAREAAEMYYVNSWIKHNYRQPFTVEELARQNDMSSSAFHRKFKSAVQMGPLQCQKQLRLTEARRLLLGGIATVSDAAVQVGYESVSQFIRDYRRAFGRSPRQDVELLQQRLSDMAHKDSPAA